MEKRLILAIALSVAIIITFQRFTFKSTPPSQPMPKEVVEDQRPPTIAAKEIASRDEKEVSLETDKYILTFSNLGGAIKKVKLKDYKMHGSSDAYTLAQIINPKEYILTMNNNLMPSSLDILPYEVSNVGNNRITYSLRIEDIEIAKRFILHNYKHIIELQLLMKNISNAPKDINYRLVGGSGMVEQSAQDIRFVEVLSKVNGTTLNFKRPKKGSRITNPGIVSWTALKSKYFSIILKPLLNTKSQFYNESKDNSFLTGVEVEEFTIPPNSSVEHRFILYAGPSQISLLRESGYEFVETINYGFFGGISKFLVSILRFFYMLVKNWGISIILLSIFLNITLFPLSLKSFKSIKRMQEIHPQMENLKAQYKDNPQKLNKEIMELYKKYNINPLSGCLPMMLQMPIFIALYQGLVRSIELKDAGFLWIKDLSSPDAVKIPLSLPLIGNSINILPLIMVIAMVIQQKSSTKSMGAAVTAEQKEQQRIMLMLMPVMFGFIFYNMPSGLVLYWVVNTILTIVEQGIIFKKA